MNERIAQLKEELSSTKSIGFFSVIKFMYIHCCLFVLDILSVGTDLTATAKYSSEELKLETQIETKANIAILKQQLEELESTTN